MKSVKNLLMKRMSRICNTVVGYIRIRPAQKKISARLKRPNSNHYYSTQTIIFFFFNFINDILLQSDGARFRTCLYNMYFFFFFALSNYVRTRLISRAYIAAYQSKRISSLASLFEKQFARLQSFLISLCICITYYRIKFLFETIDYATADEVLYIYIYIPYKGNKM